MPALLLFPGTHQPLDPPEVLSNRANKKGVLHQQHQQTKKRGSTRETMKESTCLFSSVLRNADSQKNINDIPSRAKGKILFISRNSRKMQELIRRQ